MKIIRINKDGSMNELDIKLPKKCINTLNKKKISSGNGDLKELYMWKYELNTIKCYGWYDGESGFENKHNLAPNGSSTFLEEDSSSKLLFGDIFLICLDKEKNYIDFCVTDYSIFFDIMNEGFDDCNSEDDDDDGYDKEVFEEDSDYIPDNYESDDSYEDNDIESEKYDKNELLDTDINEY